jgi:hypothetical protein
MTRPRVLRERTTGDSVSPVAWAIMTDQPIPKGPEINPFEISDYRYSLSGKPETEAFRAALHARGALSLGELWAANRDKILAQWVKDRPGTRPRCWWLFDAPRMPDGLLPGDWLDGRLPLPRQRIGGVGTAAFDVGIGMPFFDHGLPTRWLTQAEVDRLTAEDPNFTGRPLDPAHPPIYESEPAYLDRHNLLLPGERARLSERDFAPVALLIEAPAEK